MNEVTHWICMALHSFNSPKSVWGFLLLIQAPHQADVRGGVQPHALVISPPREIQPRLSSHKSLVLTVCGKGDPKQETNFLTRSVTSSLSRRNLNVVSPDVCHSLNRRAHANTQTRTHIHTHFTICQPSEPRGWGQWGVSWRYDICWRDTEHSVALKIPRISLIFCRQRYVGGNVKLRKVKTKMQRNDGSVPRFPRQHYAFGSAAGWFCLSAADRTLVKCQRERQEYSERNLSQCHFTHHKFHTD